MGQIVMLIYLALSLTSVWAEETTKTFSADGLRTMQIQTEEGDIKVQGSDMKEIKVSIINPDPSKCEITMNPTGHTLVLKAKRKSKEFQQPSCKTGFQVQTPKKLSLAASSGSGEIKVSNVNSSLVLNAGSGDVGVYDTAGDLTARLGSGDVRLKWTEPPKSGQVDIKTGSGDISLTLPEETKLQTHVLTSSGRVHNEIGETETAKFMVSIKSGSGNINIHKLAKQARR